jgi:hypothetical protein
MTSARAEVKTFFILRNSTEDLASYIANLLKDDAFLSAEEGKVQIASMSVALADHRRRAMDPTCS